ncbi:hypothetical protein B0H17DRAFT_1205234 [Mycena rosella]|uniref:Uncharacterized protein n=1 Tax=Mycena rosella TaxID=1033263 RepID=A0AAD7D827_MYCRO|nr:hypothetical protein B0H17DRAFT_1205234 [Mycena rosella]
MEPAADAQSSTAVLALPADHDLLYGVEAQPGLHCEEIAGMLLLGMDTGSRDTPRGGRGGRRLFWAALVPVSVSDTEIAWFADLDHADDAHITAITAVSSRWLAPATLPHVPVPWLASPECQPRAHNGRRSSGFVQLRTKTTYQNDGLGGVYVGFRGPYAAIRAVLAGTNTAQQLACVDVKAGSAYDVGARVAQYTACARCPPHDDAVFFWAQCPVPFCRLAGARLLPFVICSVD